MSVKVLVLWPSSFPTSRFIFMLHGTLVASSTSPSRITVTPAAPPHRTSTFAVDPRSTDPSTDRSSLVNCIIDINCPIVMNYRLQSVVKYKSAPIHSAFWIHWNSMLSFTIYSTWFIVFLDLFYWALPSAHLKLISKYHRNYYSG